MSRKYVAKHHKTSSIKSFPAIVAVCATLILTLMLRLRCHHSFPKLSRTDAWCAKQTQTCLRVTAVGVCATVVNNTSNRTRNFMPVFVPNGKAFTTKREHLRIVPLQLYVIQLMQFLTYMMLNFCNCYSIDAVVNAAVRETT